MVSLEDISFFYTVHGVPKPVFEHFSAQFEHGRITAVIGPSGCGKTTLLRLIAGLNAPQSGRIVVEGRQEGEYHNRKVPAAGPRIAFIFQDFGLLPWLTVERNAGLGLEALGIPPGERHARVQGILEELGLSEWRKAYPVRLSGGMQQRVAVARALAIDADIILMDEPFSSLDALTRESVQDMLRSIQRAHHTTIIIVTHSIEEAVYLADSVVVLDGSMPADHCQVVDNPHVWEEESAGRALAGMQDPMVQKQPDILRDASLNPRETSGYLAAVGALRHAFNQAIAQKAEAEMAAGAFAGQAARAEVNVSEAQSARKKLAPSVARFLARSAQIFAAAIFLVAAWWAAAALVQRPFLPSPSLAFAKFASNLQKGVFEVHVLASARRVCFALLAAGPLAWVLGLLAGRIPFFDNIFAPLVYFLHPLPKVAFLPILMLFLGLGDASKIALMGLVIFGQLFVTGRDAAKGIAPALLDSVRTLGFSRLSTIRLAIVPSTTPSLMSALRVSLGTAIAVLFLSETFASVDGLGWYIMDAWSRIDYPDMYAAILALSLFGLFVYFTIDAIEAVLLRWRERT
jgi:NitT/TauT family transport system permease protein